MTASSLRSLLDHRFSSLIIYPALLAAASVPVVHVLGIKGAIVFGLEILGWLVFGRILVFAYLGYLIARLSSPRVSRIACSVLVDGVAVFAVQWLDVRWLWGAVPAIVLVETLFWWPEGQAAV